MTWIKLVLVVAVSMTLLSCKQDEMDDLAKAQKCLDDIPQSSHEAAIACLPIVAKYSSQQANILKCSIYMTYGGLVENRMVQAYRAVTVESNLNREATFMSMLALDTPNNVSDGYATAVTADAYCQASGVPGLKYISGLVKMGSFMAKMINDIAPGTDFSDPAAATTAIASLVDDCSANPRTGMCASTDLSVIGQSATVLAQSYCAADKSDSEVCANINAAVQAAAGDNEAIGRALFCFLDNKTYSAGDCN